MTRTCPPPGPRHSMLLAGCLLALAGCTSMAPRYTRPAAPVSDTLPAGVPAIASDAGAVVDLPWRQVFLDTRLQQVIALALENNRDLRIALLNIETQRAQYRIQRAASLPSIDASAAQSRSRGTDASGQSGVSRSASAEVGIASWELDLFGRVRSLKDQALENWLATTETQRGTRLTLVAEVASAWLTLCADQQRLELARQTLHNQQQTLALTQERHAQGIVSGLDLSQVEASVHSARSDVASYTVQLAQDRTALELLVGTRLEAPLLPSSEALDSAVALAPIRSGLDSRVLLDRPDVLAAEHALKAANANIGAARAAFFPSIALTANTGRSSDALSSLFSGASAPGRSSPASASRSSMPVRSRPNWTSPRSASTSRLPATRRASRAPSPKPPMPWSPAPTSMNNWRHSAHWSRPTSAASPSPTPATAPAWTATSKHWTRSVRCTAPSRRRSPCSCPKQTTG